MDETETLRQIKAAAGHSDYFYRYTNATVRLAGSILNIIKQVHPTDWQQRALAAEAELGRLHAELRERPQNYHMELV